MRDDRSDGLYEQLKRAFLDEEPRSLEELRTDVADLGHDPASVAERGFEMFDTFMKKQRAPQARRRLEALREALHGFQSGTDRSLDRAKRRISEAMAFGGDELAVQASYQKLTSIEPEDLLSLDDDIALLEFIEKIEGTEIP